jgi:hypothetical protein|tara:strand:+ start:489 stop:659 length:171 start_codon:yes stop_codon:yes gene_type:complete
MKRLLPHAIFNAILVGFSLVLFDMILRNNYGLWENVTLGAIVVLLVGVFYLVASKK